MIPQSTVDQVFWKLFLAVASPSQEAPSLLQKMVGSWPDFSNLLEPSTRTWTKAKLLPALESGFAPSKEDIASYEPRIVQANEDRDEKKRRKSVLEELSDDSEIAREEKRRENFESEDLPADLERALQEGVFVSNAGLVLLWPFLPAFFKALDLWDGEAFTGAASHRRAVGLTAYLLTGASVADESELLLNKFLLGFPLTETLPLEWEISGREATESLDLLESVRTHWGALGKTSIDGMRQSFLQRSGRLQIVEDQAYLLVERTGVDVLLEKLPWQLGFIRLRWMDRPLYVEW